MNQSASTFAPPRSAYVHVPFCKHRCGYCDFTVVEDRLDLESSFLQAIETELAGLESPRPVKTIFIGGGTPTEMSEQGIAKLLQLLDEWFPREQSGGQYEFSVEANPDGLTSEKVAILQDHGVNRLSLGAQSFNDEKLKRLDRQHSAAQVAESLKLAQENFEQVSLDLIFAAPDESLASWQSDLEAAIQSGMDHLSTYGLTFEKGTSFWSQMNHGTMHAVDESLQREMYLLAVDTLTAGDAAHRFEHYEVSNFARVNALASNRCRHNEVYWTGGSWFAIGPGASRFVDGTRSTNHRSTTAYLNRVLNGDSPIAESETLDAEMIARERLVFGLRRLEGINVAEFKDATGFDIQSLSGPVIDRFCDAGLLEKDSNNLRLTREGLLVSDSLWPELL